MKRNDALKNRPMGLIKLVCVLLLAGLLCGTVQAAGLLKPVNGSASDVFIKSHAVDVTINNGFARTEVDQVFGNKSSRDLEAVYSFPLPEQASLSELSLWINGKEVIGEVLEKQRARQIYQQETRKRVDPALAEKNGYTSFEVTVFPVIANGDTRVRLVYYQPIKIESNVGRYVYPLSQGGQDEEAQSFWSVDERVHESFSFHLTLKSAFPVKEVRLPGLEDAASVSQEEIQTDGQSAGTRIEADLQSEGDQAINRDIIFYYRLADDVPARVELVPYRAKDSATGTFMVVMTPAADLKEHIEGCDWVFIVDKSGSMRGQNFAMVLDGLDEILQQMSENDRYRIVTFNNDADDVTKGYLQATEENIGRTLEQLNRIKPGGGTELYRGLMEGYKGLDQNRTTAVVLITDGITELTPNQHGDFLRILEEFDVRLFTFVLGNSGNKPLMERLANDSGGFAMNVSASDDIIGRILQAKTRILHECMYQVQMDVQGVPVREITPFEIGNLYHGQQLILFGQYDKPGTADLTLKGTISGQEKVWTCRADLPEFDTDNPELERLWALSRIEDVMQEVRDEGENDTLRNEIIDLGTQYSLVTDYTSMLVLEEDRFKQFGIDRLNRDRVARERQAQQQRNTQPVKNYRVDQNQDTFDNRSAPGFGGGSGPVGPLFIGLSMWLAGRKKRK